MSPLELVLVVLVVIWTIIFVIIALSFLMIFLSIRRVLGKINNVVDITEDVARQVNLPSKAVIAAILAFMAQNSVATLKDFLEKKFLKKGKK